MLSITDIVALAKAGYKKDDVKELIELSKEKDEKEKPQDPDPKKDDSPDDPGNDSSAKKSLPDDANEKDNGENNDPEAGADAIDYKRLYEQEKAAKEKLQQENIKRDASRGEPDTSDDDVLQEFTNSLLY